ncbi:ubiquinone anaerobic biosynthesis accessory factor UbiT [Pseudoxanthomonas beigongshangi]
MLSRMALGGTRAAIDRVDDAMVILLGGRQRLAGLAGRIKRHAGLRQTDELREQQVQRRASRLARRSGIPPASAERLMRLLIAEAHRWQARPSPQTSEPLRPMATSGLSSSRGKSTASSLLRWLPPPRRLRPWLARLPRPVRERLLLRLLASALAAPGVRRILEPITGRRLGIEAQDLDLRWVFVLEADGLRLCDGAAEAMVSGETTDLLLLASRLEDADTLFFQRRLMLTGDTELGLTVRNLLDRLPWESFPLGSRILLQRGARLARDARTAHRHHRGHAA